MTGVGAATAVITPQQLSDVMDENERLKERLKKMEKMYRMTTLAALNPRGKMTMKRLTKDFGQSRATNMNDVWQRFKNNIWPVMKILHHKWTDYNTRNKQNLCSILMSGVHLVEGDVGGEIIWKVLLVPYVSTSLNNLRSAYIREAKRVFSGETFNVKGVWIALHLYCLTFVIFSFSHSRT